MTPELTRIFGLFRPSCNRHLGRPEREVKMLAPIAPLIRDLECDAEAVLSGWKGPNR
jgi:hypothetical protein